MAYTTINKSTDNFNTVLYTGNGSNNHTITGVGFNTDLAWIKNRGGDDHRLFDKVRGVNKFVKSNSTAAETTDAIFTTNSDGYVVTNAGEVNANNGNFVGWNWKANGAGSSNSDGNVTATVSANTTAGFSIVSWTSNGQEQSIGHGLGATPSMIIMKTRNTGDGWIVGHKDNGWDYYQVLQGTNAKISDDRMFSPSGGSDPTNSVWWTNSTAWVTGGTTECIAYCFAEKAGYSKFGSYTGNGNADGTFVYTGFKPSWLMIKRTNSTENWHIFDIKRNPTYPTSSSYGGMATRLMANLTSGDDLSQGGFEFLSNGLKMTTSWAGGNGSGDTFIYMCFGQSLVGSNNVPCTAR
jgi:hypothetical protein